MKHPLYTHIKKYHPKYHPLYKFLDYERMEDICLKPEEWLLKQMKHMQVVDTPDGQQYGYLKRGSKVLAVAHMDSVQQYERTNHFGVSPFCAERYTHEETIYNGQLDDRLGVYIVMDLLSKIMKTRRTSCLQQGKNQDVAPHVTLTLLCMVYQPIITIGWLNSIVLVIVMLKRISTTMRIFMNV